jgi:biopolymer transport protein ExbD
MPVQINRGRAIALLDLTPMIDMVFNLLIFFMVVSHFAQQDQAMPVELPAGSEAMPLTARPKELFVNIDQDGQYFVASRMLDEPELARVLRQAAIDNPLNQTVVIRADRRAQWDFVATAMRLCNEAGIRDYSASLANPQQ